MLRGFTAIVLILLTLLILIGISQAYWRDRLRIVGIVKTGKWTPKIGSYKIVTLPDYDEHGLITATIREKRQCLEVTCRNVSTGWYIWVGLLVVNDGTVPVKILSPQVSIEPIDLNENFTVNTYLYGPYSSGDHIEAWDGIDTKNLSSYGSVKTITLNPVKAVTLKPSQKAVIWIKFTFNGDNEVHDTRKVVLHITIRHGVNI